MRLAIVTPVFNDATAVRCLLADLDRFAAEQGWEVTVVIVDDGSVPELDLSDVRVGAAGVQEIEVIQLTHNVGHQRAIAIGLCTVALERSCDGVIVMDADGEDRPGDIPALVRRSREHHGSIVFAERHRRPSTLGFRLLYAVYRRVFRLLTGRQIKFGNFCFLPASALKRLVNLPQLWNHFSASLIYWRRPYEAVPIERRVRYDGRSKMSIVSLIAHGLSSISIFVDSVLVRMIIASVVLGAVLVALIVGAIALRLSVNWVTPGWTTTLIASLVVILVQALVLIAVSAFVVLQGRAAILATPIRAYKDYIAGRISIHRNEHEL